MHTPNNSYQDKEIGLKELIHLAQSYLQYLWKYKWYPIAAGMLLAAFFVWREYQKASPYTAQLTFMVNEESGSSGGGGVASILGQFGLGGGGGGSYSLDKITALGRSRRIVQQMLLQKVEWQEQEDYLANHLLDYFELPAAWAENDLLRDFRFRSDSVAAYNQAGRTALINIYHRIIGSADEPGMMQIGYNEQTSILSITTRSKDEQLAILITEGAYQALERFYVDKTTEKQQMTFDNMQEKADSIQKALNSAEYQLARLQDNSQGFLLQQDRLRQGRLQRQVQVLTLAYGEALKNLETSRFMLDNITPFFQLIDPPISPLPKTQRSLLTQSIVGGFLGAGLMVVFLIGRKIYSEVMKEEPPMDTNDSVD